jgi:hypothetical protein
MPLPQSLLTGRGIPIAAWRNRFAVGRDMSTFFRGYRAAGRSMARSNLNAMSLPFLGRRLCLVDRSPRMSVNGSACCICTANRLGLGRRLDEFMELLAVHQANAQGFRLFAGTSRKGACGSDHASGASRVLL